jgi:hypothetical protein
VILLAYFFFEESDGNSVELREAMLIKQLSYMVSSFWFSAYS